MFCSDVQYILMHFFTVIWKEFELCTGLVMYLEKNRSVHWLKVHIFVNLTVFCHEQATKLISYEIWSQQIEPKIVHHTTLQSLLYTMWHRNVVEFLFWIIKNSHSYLLVNVEETLFYFDCNLLLKPFFLWNTLWSRKMFNSGGAVWHYFCQKIRPLAYKLVLWITRHMYIHDIIWISILIFSNWEIHNLLLFYTLYARFTKNEDKGIFMLGLFYKWSFLNLV